MAQVTESTTHVHEQNERVAAAAPTRDSLGRTLRDLRISVTDKCNFRCTYCMPAERYGDHYEFLRKQDLLTFEEIVRITRFFVCLGVSKIRLTGGEPLLRKDLPVLVEMLSQTRGVADLALTTNGILLGKHAHALRRAGLHRVTVSLDTLEEDLFRAMTDQAAAPQQVLEGIDCAAEAGLRPVKINVVVQRGMNDRHVADLAARFRGTGHVLRFIEYMDVGTCNGWRPEQVVPSKEVLARIHERFPVEPMDKNYHGEVADRYRYVDGSGEIGFISSVSEPFCGSCSRARLSADGRLFLCLFAADGMDLRRPLRDGATDDDLVRLLESTWQTRNDRYSEQRASLHAAAQPPNKVEMYHIGG